MSLFRIPTLSRRGAGAVYALAAYGAWGVFPIYFKALKEVSPVVVLCHRVVWSAVVMSVIIVGGRRLRVFWGEVRSARVIATLFATTLLIACNWLVYVWAVARGHILEASLGYFINPLLSVALGAVVLREKLRPMQAIAVALALLGVLVLTVGSGVVPWISLALAGTFATYGLLRKTVAIDAAGGLLAETLLLVVPSVGFLSLAAEPWGQGGAGASALLIAAGPITAIPLWFFARGARRLPLTAMGFLQYVSPTLQFLIAVAIYGESFQRIHLVTFGFIWAGVALFMRDLARPRLVCDREAARESSQ